MRGGAAREVERARWYDVGLVSRVTVGPGVVCLIAPFTTAAEVRAAAPLSDHAPLLLETPGLPGLDAVVAYNVMTRMSTKGEKTNNGWGASESHHEYQARLERLGRQLGELAATLPPRTVLALQELPTERALQDHLLSAFHAGGGDAWQWGPRMHTRPNGFSHGLLVRDGTWELEDVTSRHAFGEQAHRIQVVRLTAPQSTRAVVLANVHLRWGVDHEADLAALLEATATEHVVILGDFNRALASGPLQLGGRTAQVSFPTVGTSVTYSRDHGRFAVNDGFIVAPASAGER